MPAHRPFPALVTGASRGLGHAAARHLAGCGWHIVAVARTGGALEELDDEIRAAGGQATLSPMDITEAKAMQHLCRGIYDRWGGLGLWLHTAIHPPALTPADQVAGRDFDRAVKTNIHATARLIGYVAPLLLAGGGTALIPDDPQTGRAFFGGYAATKAGQIALARAWAAETVRTGPAVRILEPAAMATTTRARFYPGEDPQGLATPAAEAARLLAGLPEG